MLMAVMGVFATTSGTTGRLQSCADNWDFLLLASPLKLSPSAVLECAYNILSVRAGAIAVNADTFREGTVPRYFTDLQCFGNETAILECARREFTDAAPCATAGVVCQGQQLNAIQRDC